MKNRVLPIIAAVVLIAVIVTAAIVSRRHGQSASGASTSSQGVATDTVSISDFSFSPMVITVKAGSTVTWTNSDDVNHTITDDVSGIGPSSHPFNRGGTYSFTFTKVGTYTYHCMPHPYMHGTVIVTQ